MSTPNELPVEAQTPTQTPAPVPVSSLDAGDSNRNMSEGNARSSNAPSDPKRPDINARLANPLADYSHDELEEMGEAYARKYQLGNEEDIQAFRHGAVCAQDPLLFDTYSGLSDREREIMRDEFVKRWHQPTLIYLVIVLCSTCAAVQGMGESAWSS